MVEIVIMNDLEWLMLSYYVVYYDKFRKIMQQTEKEVLKWYRPRWYIYQITSNSCWRIFPTLYIFIPQTSYTFVNSIYPQFTNLDVPSKFDLIMNNPKVIKRTAQFIVTCYDVRYKQLFNEMDFNVNNDI